MALSKQVKQRMLMNRAKRSLYTQYVRYNERSDDHAYVEQRQKHKKAVFSHILSQNEMISKKMTVCWLYANWIQKLFADIVLIKQGVTPAWIGEAPEKIILYRDHHRIMFKTTIAGLMANEVIHINKLTRHWAESVSEEARLILEEISDSQAFDNR